MARAKGMTLIELIIVMVIFGILLAVAMPSYLYYTGLARASRLNTYATAMMTAARIANASNIAAQLPQTDLFVLGDGLATYGWPKSTAICNLIYQELTNAPDTVLGGTVVPGGAPITCTLGELQDTSASGPNCKATYVESSGPNVTAYVNSTNVTAANCE